MPSTQEIAVSVDAMLDTGVLNVETCDNGCHLRCVCVCVCVCVCLLGAVVNPAHPLPVKHQLAQQQARVYRSACRASAQQFDLVPVRVRVCVCVCVCVCTGLSWVLPVRRDVPIACWTSSSLRACVYSVTHTYARCYGRTTMSFTARRGLS